MKILLFVCTAIFTSIALAQDSLSVPFGWALGSTKVDQIEERMKCIQDDENYLRNCSKYSLGKDKLIAHMSKSGNLIKLEIVEPSSRLKKLGIKRYMPRKTLEEKLKSIGHYEVTTKQALCKKGGCTNNVRMIATYSLTSNGNQFDFIVRFDGDRSKYETWTSWTNPGLYQINVTEAY